MGNWMRTPVFTQETLGEMVRTELAHTAATDRLGFHLQELGGAHPTGVRSPLRHACLLLIQAKQFEEIAARMCGESHG